MGDKVNSKQQQQVALKQPAEEEDLRSEEEESDSDGSDEEEQEELDEEGEEPGGAEAQKRRSERKKREEDDDEEEEVIEEEDLWNFPKDNEGWTESHLGEYWEDYWGDTIEVGHDPELVDPEDKEEYEQKRREGSGPPTKPYYVPFRKFYPLIPENHPDVECPEDVVEELERMEEFLAWSSYIFEDGSSYEGTVWDDLAHGKGVYTTPLELCRYEGEWFQNMMEGHGVLEVDVPVAEPPPGSKEAEKMRAEGAVLKSDHMNAFDKEWLKMDIEDLTKAYGDMESQRFEESPDWVQAFRRKPEKGHYKYAGQWKHNRMHGCGVYEINGRPIWGKFYFGEILPDVEECTLEQSAFHSSLAEVAAAKARMFVNKPDGMVREVKGPFTDPQHPYMYEEEDMWMAPGFINAYYEVPEVWKRYVEDVDQEREMWLNSFVKSPLRIPMPPELQYWWSKDDEFVVLGIRPTSALHYDPENVAKSEEGLEGDVLLHVPTGQIINWTTDHEGRFRFFIQPFNENGGIKPEAAVPLPLGFDEYLPETDTKVQDPVKKQGIWEKLKGKWDNVIKVTGQKWEQEDKERQQRWKEEDQAVEEQQKLRGAEVRLAEEIEEEKFNDRYREIYEEFFGDKDQEASEEQRDENRAEDNTVEAEVEKGKFEDTQKTAEGAEEDDDEEDKKPRSFGKVAFLDTQHTFDNKEKGTPKKQEGSAPFPTAFATLSLAPQEILRSQLFHTVHNWLHKNQSSQQSLDNLMRSSISGKAKKSYNISGKDTGHVNFSMHKKNVKLTGVSPVGISHQKATRLVQRSFLFNRPTETLNPHFSVGMKCGNGRSYLRSNFMSRNSVYRQSFELNAFWCKPEYCFLSMAVPLENVKSP